MGSCIICGTSVDGHICELHEEDVVFEFRGSHPNQLTVNRFYRGSVDGFAEFGVFVDIGDSVTGLLHRSELDQRLDSLDWDPGETVFVKVKNVRDNGNVDLGWSIRQREREFRGTLVDDPEFDHARLAEEVDDEGNEDPAGADAGGRTSADQGTSSDGGEHRSETAQERGRVSRADDDERADRGESVVGSGDATADAEGGDADGDDRGDASEDAEVSGGEAGETTATGVETEGEDGADAATEAGGRGAAAAAERAGGGSSAAVAEAPVPDLVQVDDLADLVGEDVRLEGEIVDARQTSGPTVFELRDETGTVDCAAFVEAGVRAYPDVEEGDLVRLDGESRRRRGELQVETEELTVLEGEERETVEQRLADALADRARPEAVDPLAEDGTIDALGDSLIEAATAIRRAVITDRPVIVRHSATADGYVAGVALERATLPLVREEHRQSDAVYHYFDRRPLEGGVYDMDDATKDVTNMLENRERHDEAVPLIVFVAAGGTRESLDGFELLDVYGAPRVVVDDAPADEAVRDAVETVVSPPAEDAAGTTATTLAANVAAHVEAGVREDLQHLPAVSYWDVPPASYVEAAADAGYDESALRELREAVALEAYYQSYEDKRELITDLLFGDEETDVGGLAANVAEQFRTKMDSAVETATANVEHRDVGDATVAVLDTDAFTHRFDFPPETLLLDELFRQADDDVDALVGVDEDTLYVRSGDPVDLHAVAEGVAGAAPDAGVSVQSAREGSVRFLAGERDAVLDAALDEVAERV